MKILIVEDDFISRMLLQKLLIPYGRCDTAENGKEAVEAFENAHSEDDPYSLICMDIMMPEMDGKEALKIIREKEKQMGIKPQEEVPVFMTTALDTPKDVIESYYSGGCTSYIVKPIEREKILSLFSEYKLI